MKTGTKAKEKPSKKQRVFQKAARHSSLLEQLLNDEAVTGQTHQAWLEARRELNSIGRFILAGRMLTEYSPQVYLTAHEHKIYDAFRQVDGKELILIDTPAMHRTSYRLWIEKPAISFNCHLYGHPEASWSGHALIAMANREITKPDPRAGDQTVVSAILGARERKLREVLRRVEIPPRDYFTPRPLMAEEEIREAQGRGYRLIGTRIYKLK